MSEPTPAERTISVFGMEDDGRVNRSLMRKRGEFRYGRSDIPLDLFRQRAQDFMTTVGDVIGGLAARAGEYELAQVEVNVEISAKGQLSLLGTGGELAGKGGLTFTFKKSSTAVVDPTSS